MLSVILSLEVTRTKIYPCVDFLDFFVSQDNENIHALSDYIVHCDFGDDTVNSRLLDRLAPKECHEHQKVSFKARLLKSNHAHD